MRSAAPRLALALLIGCGLVACAPRSPQAVPTQAPGITISGAFQERISTRVPSRCGYLGDQLLATLGGSPSQFSLGIHNFVGPASLTFDLRYVDSPWLDYGGTHGGWESISGTISITSVAGSLVSGSVDAQLRDMSKKSAPTARAVGTWACRGQGYSIPHLSGGITLTGAVHDQFNYQSPLACPLPVSALGLEGALGWTMTSSSGAQLDVQVGQPGPLDVGHFGATIIYQGPGGYGRSVTYDFNVTYDDARLVSGSLDADLAIDSVSANTHAQGTWACRTTGAPSPAPAAGSPTPSSSGQLPVGADITITGLVQARFLYSVAPSCFNHTSVTFNSVYDGQLTVNIPNPTGVGSYPIDPSKANGPSVDYMGPRGTGNATSGSVSITTFDPNVISGSIDAELAISGGASQSHVTGSWACYQGAPPGVPPVATPSPSGPPPTSGGVTVTGPFEAYFLYHSPLLCDPFQTWSLSFNSTAYGILSIRLPDFQGAGVYVLRPTFDGPSIDYIGPAGSWKTTSGRITVNYVSSTLYAGTVDAELTNSANQAAPQAHVTGTWACTHT